MQTKPPYHKNKPPGVELLQRRDRSLPVLPQSSWSDMRAWSASCIFHTVVLVLFALMWRSQSRGTSGDTDRPVGIAVAHQTGKGTEYSLEGGSSSSGSSTSASSSQTVSLTTNDLFAPPISIDSLVAELMGDSNGVPTGAAGSQGTGLSGDGNSSGSGTGKGKGKGNKAKTSFFGVEGTGSSFVFVVDRSDSMNANDASPLRSAKRELLKSLASLNEYHQFQIVFYNDSVFPMSGKMIFATDADKRRATQFVRSIPGDGGTSHMPALKLGLAMRPDVLFFLTDADDPSLSLPQLRELQEKADLSRTTIHTVQFNLGPAANNGSWIRGLAEMNRGTYKYLDVSILSPPSNE